MAVGKIRETVYCLHHTTIQVHRTERRLEESEGGGGGGGGGGRRNTITSWK